MLKWRDAGLVLTNLCQCSNLQQLISSVGLLCDSKPHQSIFFILTIDHMSFQTCKEYYAVPLFSTMFWFSGHKYINTLVLLDRYIDVVMYKDFNTQTQSTPRQAGAVKIIWCEINRRTEAPVGRQADVRKQRIRPKDTEEHERTEVGRKLWGTEQQCEATPGSRTDDVTGDKEHTRGAGG